MQLVFIYYIYITKTRRMSVTAVGVAGWAWSTHATVSASLLPAVGLCVFKHAHVFMTTYRVDVYRSRPIGASLITTSPQQECLALKGLHTGAGWAWWREAA